MPAVQPLKPVAGREAAADFDFAAAVMAWQKRHGRHGLPWQGTRDPYRVWLSEIMLQQTQVGTVLAYYPRFLQRFPSVQALAVAPEDAVMQQWAGLGYYSRARHLHHAAQMVAERWAGVFPRTADELCLLPGVGKSTAAAIAAFCFGQRAAIFDANVQRVLARYAAYEHDLAQAKNKNALWAQACTLLPTTDLARSMPAYTQGLMDLGATVCTPRKPQCGQCPLATHCSAYAQGRQLALPVVEKKLQRRTQAVYLHWQQQGSALRLDKRPARGIWGGLYCLPELSADAYASLSEQDDAEILPVLTHVLTHRDLQLHIVRQMESPKKLGASGAQGWYSSADLAQLGLPQPIAKLLLS